MLTLLLQKPSKTSKTKDHLKVFERRQIMGRREYCQTFERTGRHLCSSNDSILLYLPVRFGELTIRLFHNDAKYEYEHFRKLTSSTQLIKGQCRIYSVSEKHLNSIKRNKQKKGKTI